MKKNAILIFSALLTIILLFTACQKPEPTPTVKPQPLTFTVTPDQSKSSGQTQDDTVNSTKPDQQSQPVDNPPLERLNPILWVQTSAEFLMTATQSYVLATVMLDKGLEDPNWTAAVEQVGDYTNLPPAIILDVDETVLDNSPNQARFLLEGISWDTEKWNEWVREEKAPAIPGVVDFLQYAQSKGVTIFYMTNRSHEVEDATRANLINVGCPVEDEFDTLFTQGEEEDWGSDKTNRRSLVAEDYRIILLIGDDPNDFVSGTKEGNPQSRNDGFTAYQDYWGERWIMIPNAMYGGWEAALYDFDYGLSYEDKLSKKFDWLDTKE